MLDKKINGTLSDEEMDRVVGGIAEDREDLRRFRCGCGNTFMVNPAKAKTQKIYCDACGHDCTDEILKGVIVADSGFARA